MRDHMTDGRISLRKYCIDDALALYGGIQESIEALTRWGFYHVGFTLEDAVEDVASRIVDWKEGKSFKYLIEHSSEPVFLGNCGIAEIEPQQNHAALGWWVRSSMINKGIATAAGRLVAQAAFEDLHLTTIYIYVMVENTPSRRVAEKLGAVLSHIQPEADGRFCAVYALKPEFLISDPRRSLGAT